MKKQLKSKKQILALVGAIVLSTTTLASCGQSTSGQSDNQDVIAQSKEATAKSNMNDFNAETLNGEKFSSEDLKKYDLTMVNIWYTGCKPCVEKMPDTQKLKEQLPDNVNLVSVCADGNENKELASKIVNESGVKYPALIPDDKLMDSLVKNVSVFPTTIFVDKDGNIVGEPIQGAFSSDYVKNNLDEVNKRLEMVKK